MAEMLVLNNVLDPNEQLALAVSKKIVVPFTGNQIIFATTPLNIEVAVKVTPNKSGAVHEWSGLTMTNEIGIKNPQPLMLGKNPLGKYGVVTSLIRGRLLSFIPSEAAKFKFGQVVRQLHTLMATSSVGEDYSYYDQRIRLWTDEKLAQFYFQQLALTMINYCNTARVVFNHNDLHDGQLIVSPNGEAILIDFENWKFDRPLNDIGFYLFHCLRVKQNPIDFKKFMYGYLGDDSLSENEKSALMFNLLFISTRALIYFAKQKSNYLEIAQRTQERVLNFITQEALWKIL